MKIKTIGGKINLSVIIISLIALAVASSVLFYIQNQTTLDTYHQIKDDLKVMANAKLNAKKAVGISNAVGIANDGQIKIALEQNDRSLAIASLKTLSTGYKANTPFKNIKVHIHTKDNRSFVRAWKLNKFGDDLSSFRASVVKVNSSNQPVTTFEVGKAGLGLRAVTPISKNGVHLGSLEFMQGLNSVAKGFKKEHSAFLLLMDESVKVKPIASNKKFKNYGISQKFIDSEFLSDAKNINMKELFDKGYILGDKYFYTYIKIKDFQNKELGIALLGKPLTIVNHTLDSALNIIEIALGILASMAIIIILFLMIIVKKIVIDPLHKLNNTITHLMDNAGDTSIRIEKKSDDELGDITDNFNRYLKKIDDGIKEDMVLINEVKKVVDIAKTGLVKQKVEVTTSNQSLNELRDGFNDLLDIVSSKVCGNLNKISDALEHYGKLDFTHRITGNLGNVSKGLNTLADIINEMLVENKQNGLTLNASSHTLLSNVDKLSNNSNQAAVELEQTTASVEELSAHIQNTVKVIEEMGKYGKGVKSTVAYGMDLASKTTVAMNEVDEKVQSISDTIGVIDQISFQTNILSLNAAVEAATAGEAGKGFAVVAQEVRNLASRSADAANEIKSIVESATTKANYGKSIADEMIRGYSELQTSITETFDYINSVQSSSKEQNLAIHQITDALNALDQQTQQNASIASQTKDVAVQTDAIANLVVESANEKEFIGKNSVKARS